MALEGAQAVEVVGRGEDGEVWQRRLHPLRERLVAGASQERIQPDEPPRAHAECLQRTGELGRIARVPAVAQDDHYRAAVDEPTPLGLEGGEAGADAGAARPVADRVAQPAQG